MTVVEISTLNYRWPGDPSEILKVEAFELGAGENVFLSGPSGCGKSTLLSAIAGVIDVPQGSVRVGGTDVGTLSGGERDRFRVDNLGMIFQVFNLLSWLSAVENVLLPCRFSTQRRDRAGPDPETSAMQLLAELGLADPELLNKPASSLSAGQQQRVAAARAVIGAPQLVLADEPTSALDESAKGAFVELLLRECADAGAALLFVSHDRTLESHFDRTVDFQALNGGTGC